MIELCHDIDQMCIRDREKSLDLDVGYNPIDREWDLIIKYSGSLERVRTLANQVVELLNEYAIITILESRIDELAQLVEVEYIEKPKRLFFQVANGRRVSCIDSVQDTRFALYGQGVLVAVIDSGKMCIRDRNKYLYMYKRYRHLVIS